MGKITKNFVTACEAMLGKTFYLYDPFESTIHEVLVRDLAQNMFGEPDEIFTKLRLYADERGLKNNKDSWDDEKSIASFPYLTNDLTDKRNAIMAFQADLAMKKNKLKEELKCVERALLQLSEEKSAKNI
jgi:hypothetical protein